MPVFNTSFITKFVDVSTDLGGKGWVLKDYIIDVYPNLIPGVKTPALWLWGLNSLGQLGDNTIVSKSSPVQTITSGVTWKQVACGYDMTAVIKTDGTLWTWGRNTNGQLGDNTTAPKSSPIQTVAGGATWKQTACGFKYAAAIKTDGTLWAWGDNYAGKLGDNTGTSRSSPVQTITLATNWSQVSCGYQHTAAVKTDGTLWTWGRNNFGQLGNNSIVNRASPVQTVTGGTTWRQVACGYGHTAAIKTDGTLWLWGNNAYRGMLGDNTTVPKSSPVQTIIGGTNWLQVACGYRHTAAVKTDGTLWTWGDNTQGALGDNTTDRRSSPVQTVAGGNTWKQVACTMQPFISVGFITTPGSTAAIKIDGTLWTWGNNPSGVLGDNSTAAKVSPVQTIARGVTWKQVAGGSRHMAAIADGNY